MLKSPLLRSFAVALCSLVLMLCAGVAGAQEAPDQLVKRVADDVLATIKADPKLQSGDQERVREVIETKLLPHLDFKRMTSLAMGRNWRSATPEQQDRLINEFRTLLVRTYSGAMTQYRNETIDTKPVRIAPTDTDTMVRTTVNRQQGAPVSIDYAMAKEGNTWKVYDVVVGGVSLVTNYRDEFNNVVQASGVDGLIKQLADKNRGGKA